MGKMQALLLATAAQQGVLRVDAGLKLSAPGVVGALRPLADLWVAADGDDTSGDGSMGNPFQTLARVFAFIVATPLAGGYTVHLPSGDWFESVGLPPPNTSIIGHGATRTTLAGLAGAALAWPEGASDAGLLSFSDLRLVVDVTGRDGGSIELSLLRSHVQGTLRLIGRLGMDGCDGDFASFVNCSNVSVRNPVSSPSSSLLLSYDPTAGTNGPGSVCNEVVGGLWGNVQYDSQDASVPLYVLGAKVSGGLFAFNYGRIEAASGTTAASLTANDASSEIAYDGPADDVSPTFHGLGKFRNAELVLKRMVPMDFGTGDVTVAVPPQTVALLKNVFVTADLPMVDVTWVSSTASSITLHVVPPATLHPAYELRILVKP